MSQLKSREQIISAYQKDHKEMLDQTQKQISDVSCFLHFFRLVRKFNRRGEESRGGRAHFAAERSAWAHQGQQTVRGGFGYQTVRTLRVRLFLDVRFLLRRDPQLHSLSPQPAHRQSVRQRVHAEAGRWIDLRVPHYGYCGIGGQRWRIGGQWGEVAVSVRWQQCAFLGDSERVEGGGAARDREGASNEGRRSIRWVGNGEQSDAEGSSEAKKTACWRWCGTTRERW